MMKLDRIIAHVTAPSPQGCQTPGYRLAIEDFFQNGTKDSRLKNYLRFRNFAEFRNVPRSHWPGALEKYFMVATKYEAVEDYERFRSWLKIHKSYCIKPKGTWGIGLEGLSRHLRAKGLINWHFDRRYELKIETAWSTCDPAFRKKVEEYFDYLRARNYSPRTIQCAKICLRVLGRYLKNHGQTYFEMNYDRALGFNRWVLSKDWSKWHQRSAIEKARNFYKWLLLRKEVEENHFDTLRPIGVIHSLPTYLTEEEMNVILDQPLEVMERVLIEFFYATGCRISEAISLNLADLSLRSRSIKCLGKGCKERMLFFNRATEAALKEYVRFRSDHLKLRLRSDEPALFVGHWGRRICNIAIDDRLRAIAYRAGVSKRVTPHVLRHTYATHLLNHGADLHSLMTLLGHSCIESTIRYLHVATDRLTDVYRKCHPRK